MPFKYRRLHLFIKGYYIVKYFKDEQRDLYPFTLTGKLTRP